MAMPRWLQVLIGFLFPTEPEPERTPVEVFDAAIRASRQRFLDLRAAASPLFAARDALAQQIEAHESKIRDLQERARECMARGETQDALAAATRQGQLEGELERTRKELDAMQEPIRRVENNLRRLEAEVRDLEAERDKSASLLKSAQARVAVDRILAPGATSETQKELAAAREAVEAQLVRAAAHEQLTAGSIEGRFAALDEELGERDALARLEQSSPQNAIDSTDRPALPPPRKETSL
jgi:phage shock protein A